MPLFEFTTVAFSFSLFGSLEIIEYCLVFRILGGFLTLSPEMCFVVEDELGVMGYAVAALDAKSFRQKQRMSWLPAMCEKYPKPDKMEELTPAEVWTQKYLSLLLC